VPYFLSYFTPLQDQAYIKNDIVGGGVTGAASEGWLVVDDGGNARLAQTLFLFLATPRRPLASSQESLRVRSLVSLKVLLFAEPFG